MLSRGFEEVADKKSVFTHVAWAAMQLYWDIKKYLNNKKFQLP